MSISRRVVGTFELLAIIIRNKMSGFISFRIFNYLSYPVKNFYYLVSKAVHIINLHPIMIIPFKALSSMDHLKPNSRKREYIKALLGWFFAK